MHESKPVRSHLAQRALEARKLTAKCCHSFNLSNLCNDSYLGLIPSFLLLCRVPRRKGCAKFSRHVALCEAGVGPGLGVLEHLGP